MTGHVTLAIFPIIDDQRPGKAIEVRQDVGGPYRIVETIAGLPDRELEEAGYSSGAAIARGLALAGWATAVLADQLAAAQIAGGWDYKVRSYAGDAFCLETVHRGPASLAFELAAIRSGGCTAEVTDLRRGRRMTEADLVAASVPAVDAKVAR